MTQMLCVESPQSLIARGSGATVVLTASAPKQSLAVQPNLAVLGAMARIAEIHKGMNPKHGKDTLHYISEAREGAMYGYGSDE
jgi:hypothetical protein